MHIEPETMLVIGVLVGVVGMLLLNRYTKDKNIPVEKYVDRAKDILDTASPIVDKVAQLAPNDPRIIKLELIKNWGLAAAGYAQQICHTGDIKAEDRAAVAENIVINVLRKQLKIEPTESELLLIDVVIKAACNSFGHKE